MQGILLMDLRDAFTVQHEKDEIFELEMGVQDLNNREIPDMEDMYAVYTDLAQITL